MRTFLAASKDKAFVAFFPFLSCFALLFFNPVVLAQSLTLEGTWSLPLNDPVVGSVARGSTVFTIGPSTLTAVDATDRTHPVVLKRLSFPPMRNVCPKLVASDRYVFATGGVYSERKTRILAFDVSNPTEPMLRGSIDIPGYAPSSLAIEGDQLYVAKDTDGFEILSVADPARMSSLGTSPLFEARDFIINNGLAYVAAGGSGFKIVDVTNPSIPWVVGGASFIGSARSIALNGSTAFVSVAGSGTLIKAFDVNDPSAPTLISESRIGPYASIGLHVSGNVLVVALDSAVFSVALYNIANPASPSLAGTIKTVAISDAKLDGQYLYVSQGVAGLVIYDVQDPANRRRLGSIAAQSSPRGLTAVGNLIFLPDAWNGVHIIDVSDPSRPVETATYVSSEDLGYGAGGVGVVGTKMIFSLNTGFDIVDLSDPRNPTLIGKFRGASGPSSGFVVSGQYVFTTHGEIVDVSNLSNPVRVGTLPISANKFEIAGNFIYYNNLGEVGVIDISTPLAPRLRGTFSSYRGSGIDSALAWPYVYLKHSPPIILDVRDPDNLKKVNSPPLSMIGGFAAASGQSLFQIFDIGGNSSLHLWDIREPTSPSFVTEVFAPTGPLALAAQGDRAYSLTGSGILRIYLGQLGPPPLKPTLQILLDGTNVILRWPKDYSDFKLHATSNLTNPWSLLIENPPTAGDFVTFTNARPIGTRFYKLVK